MTLLAPAFLVGLLAVGLPLWLHRLSSENPNRRPFSSLMFLEAGEPRRVLAKQLQYLLLLSLRIALLVLLVLAFAQPALFRDAASAAGTDARRHVLVLDVSASMAYEDRFERARDAALDVIGDFGAEDRGQLVLASRSTELATQVTGDRAVLRNAVNAASPSVFRVDYGALTGALDGVIGGAELPVVLHWITDTQANALPTRFAELAPRVAAGIEVHDIAEGGASNWAVERFAGSALSGELSASVRSFADSDVERTLRLELNGMRVDEQTVAVPAGGSAEADFDALELDAGSNRVTVSMMPGDGLAADDARYLALKRAEPRPVLVVSAALDARDTLYVAAALETLEGLALEPETTTPANLSDAELDDYAFVVVNDVGALGEADRGRLDEYVAAGGAALIGLGPRSSGFEQVPVTGQLYAAGARRSMSREQAASIGAVDAGHPAVRGVEGLRAAQFFNHIGIEPADDDSVLVRLENGDPLLVESPLGDGRVLLVTTTLDRQWSDLPVQPAFVPLVAGLANHLLGGAGFSNEAELGSVLSVGSLGMTGGRIFAPDGEPAAGLGGGTDGVVLDQTGFYEVVGGGRTELVAVNFDTRESDLETLDPATVERWEALGQAGDAAPREAAATAEPVLARLAPWLIALLLAAVLVESWVGNWHLKVRRGIAA